MKNLLFAIAFLFMYSSFGQDKWRTLTFTAGSSIGVNTKSYAPQLNASLDYELEDGFAIVSWNGFAYNSLSDSSWLASQTTLDKRFNSGVTLGMGYMYVSSSTNMFVPINTNDDAVSYVTFKLQYRIKL